MKFTRGLVTFADILGWKGIWQKQDTNPNPIERILEIKNEIINYGNKQVKLDIYNNIRKKNNRLPSPDTFKFYPELDPVKFAFDKLNTLKQDIQPLDVKPSNFRITNMVSHSIDLISDTFIICTAFSNKQRELKIHGLINKALIETCLQNNLMIRGATSYGDYLGKESIYLGPAIDDVASWHELPQEVAIFLSPSALLNFEEELKESQLYMRREVKLKNNKLNTYCVRWNDIQDSFKEIAKNESPMHPEIAEKYLNTLEYLESRKEQQLKKEVKRPRKRRLLTNREPTPSLYHIVKRPRKRKLLTNRASIR